MVLIEGVAEDGSPPLPWLAQPLADALARGRSHALLLHAAPGNGALAFAFALAQSLLCDVPQAGGLACGRCAACRRVVSRGHADLFLLLPEVQRRASGWLLAEDKEEQKDKKPSRQIRIDEVRALIDWTQRTSALGRGKVALLHPAEAMNEASASALLKTLEEPPAGTRLLLTAADPAALLPTVLSRCQRLVLAEPPATLALPWLAAQGVARPEVLLAGAGGRPLDALELAHDGVDATAWAALPQAVAAGQAGAVAGWPVPRLVDALMKLCHDATAQAAGGRPRFFPSVPAGAAPAALGDWWQALQRVARDAGHPWNEPLLADALVTQGRSALASSGPGRSPRRRLDTLAER